MTMKPLAKVRPAPAQAALPGLEREPEDPMLAYRRRVDADIELVGAAATLQKRWALQEAESIWAAEARGDTRVHGTYAPGDVVVYTARFLQSACAGLQALDIASEWTVQECSCALCELGRHVCTTQNAEQWGEGYGWRHLAKANIRHRRHLSVDECAAGMQPLVSVPRAANTRWRMRGER